MKNTPRTLVLSDYDDTIYRTDDFVAHVLEILKQHNLTKLADEIKHDIVRLRAENGTSAGYDLAAKIADFYEILEEELRATNAAKIFPDARKFYEIAQSRADVDFVIWTRGQDSVQKLKLVGTPFETADLPPEIFPDSYKVARILREIEVLGGNFKFGAQWYNRLIMVDNDARYFKNFAQLARRVDAHGYLLHHDNPRFAQAVAADGVVVACDFHAVKL
jgi:hypothetical protein